ncbi:hypothetical protein BKP37_10995 [Anaerobacillus alkalilacustris]|uniref:SLH domain-containing protein n=1 Tax=Anaerobacillus alkalilacustris TaxID=393763 RepID=A0A1S2LKI7_9BACI|nr:S-layer homology domain-containing protein [Anaerobacillus alkalilacustris]OIJ13039.1 hypothetical protein BKP37_10995 [Anaerobacillus alkalilacustris]
MKNTILTVSVATIMMGTLVGCGVEQQTQNVERPIQMNAAEANQTRGAVTGQTTQSARQTAANHSRQTNLQQIRANQVGVTQVGNRVGAERREANRQERLVDKGHQGKFKDVQAGEWYSADVEWLTDIGFFAGVGDGEFQPNKPLTRAEAAALFARLHDDRILVFPEPEEVEEEKIVDENVGAPEESPLEEDDLGPDDEEPGDEGVDLEDGEPEDEGTVTPEDPDGGES